MRRKITILTLSFAFLHLSFVIVFNYFNTKNNELLSQYNNLVTSKIAYTTWLAGDSHTERSVDCNQLDKTKSIAYYGENNVMTYYKIKSLLENSEIVTPRYIVFPCDIVTFAKGFNIFRTQSGFYYDLIPFEDYKEFEENPYASKYNHIKTSIFPYVEWQFAFNAANTKREVKSSTKFSDLNVEKRIKFTQNLIQNELMCGVNEQNLFDTIAINYLNKTIALCKQYNIKPVFVKFPICKEVFDEVALNVNSNFLHNRPSDSIVNAANIPILDFEHLLENNQELFFDCHHLNKDGQELFTPLFKQRLDSLLLEY